LVLKYLFFLYWVFIEPSASGLGLYITKIFIHFIKWITAITLFLLSFLKIFYWTLIGAFKLLTHFLVSNYISFLWIQFILFAIGVYGWTFDVIKESSYEGRYTSRIRWYWRSFVYLFVGSEVLIFATLILTQLAFSASPNANLGGTWPPFGIPKFDYRGLATVNLIILITSGISANCSLRAANRRDLPAALDYLIYTILLGWVFLIVQFVVEYQILTFSFQDSSFGSIFYMATGLHGSHVLVGVLWLQMCWFRLKKHNFQADDRLSFRMCVLYWHFVDVVWVFIYWLFYMYNS